MKRRSGGQLALWDASRCVYCNSLAETRDHVPPKCFLEEPYPDNLLTVPCCRKCNNSYSLDEQYVMAVMAQVGPERTFGSKLDPGGAIDRALNRRPALDQRLVDQLGVAEDGRVYLEPENSRIDRVMKKITAGLYYHRYSRYVALRDLYPSALLQADQVQLRIKATFYTGTFKAKQWVTIQSRVFEYIFVEDPWTPRRLICTVSFHDWFCGICGCPRPSRRRHKALGRP